ncbi:D-2-hydroxyacid dehydrogenase [Achromobacter aegrifaciens]
MTKLAAARNLHVLVSPHIKETGGEAIAGLADELGVEVTLIAATSELTEQALAGIDAAFFSRDIHSLPGRPPSNNATRLFFRMLDACTGLQWLHIFSAGSDRPKYKEFQARGVSVTTSPDASCHAVATSALAGILALNKQLPWHYANQLAHAWRAVPDERCPLPLDRQTAVLIGTGHIGAALATYLQALELRTIGINRSGKAVPGFDETLPQSALDSVIGKADWLVICCPLTDETLNLVNADRLAALPPTAHLINVGRGGIVDEQALLQALRDKRIAGACLDVFEREPLAPECGFWELDNVIVTPHSAARIADFDERAFACFLDNLQRWLSKQALRNVAA